MNIVKLYKDTLNGNGGSYNLVTGEVPNSGYMVALYGFELKIPLKDFSEACLKEFIDNNQVIFNEDYFLGAWVEDGVVYLDISINMINLDLAIDVAKVNNQLAIYDLNNNETIYIK